MSTGIPQGRGIQLQEHGWIRRFTAMGRRLNEAEELYCQLGFETLLVPAELIEGHLSRAEGCESCIVTTLARTIYTRPRRRADVVDVDACS
jgi:hypothetical protein